MSRYHIESKMQTRKSKAAPRIRRLNHLERPTPSVSLGAGSLAADLIIHLVGSSQANDLFVNPSWYAKDSLIFLISDLVTASGGTPSGSRDGSLVAQFGESTRALTAAKRIQLALLGFAKHYAREPAWSVIAVQPSDPQTPDSADTKAASAVDWKAVLESAQPGQILVAAPIWEGAKNLGEYRVHVVQDGAQVYEFVWAQAEIYKEFRNLSDSPPESPATEREETSSVSRVQGVERAAVGSADDGAFLAEQAAFSEAHLQAPESVPETVRPLAAGTSMLLTSLRRIPNHFRIALAVMAVIAVCVLGAYLRYGPHHKSTPQGIQTTVRSEIQQVQPQTDQHPASDDSSPSLKTPAKSEKPAGGRCGLNPREIPGFLEMADQKRARGSYGDAERQYNAVLGCEPGNTRAREGLAKTKIAKALPAH